MRQKHTPIRTCVGCGAERSKRELVRIVRTPEGTIVADATGKKSGRGPAEAPEKLRELEVPEAAIAVQEAPAAPVQSGVALPKSIVVSELAQRLGVGPVDVLKELVQMGSMI